MIGLTNRHGLLWLFVGDAGACVAVQQGSFSWGIPRSRKAVASPMNHQP